MLRSYLNGLDRLRRESPQPPPPDKWSGPEAFVLHHGRTFESRPLGEVLRMSLVAELKSMRAVFKKRECFYNSQRIALCRPNLFTYVEGWCVSDFGLPVLHGWVIYNPTGHVVDMTLRRRGRRPGAYGDRVIGEFSEPREYFGIELTDHAIRHRMRKTQSLGSIIDYWEADFPLLTLPREEVERDWLKNKETHGQSDSGGTRLPQGSRERVA